MLTKKFKKEYILIILISIILSAAGWYYYGNPSDTIYGDSGYYWNAINLINNDFSNILFSKNIGIAESLNAILLGILSYLPVNIFAIIYIFQILLYTLTAVLIYKFCLDFIGKKGAIFVLIFYFFNYKHLQHIYILKPGVWVNLLLAMTILAAYYVYKNPEKSKYWILFGISTGFLFLQDIRYIPHIGILSLALTTQLKPFKENFKRIPLFIIIIIIVISPWLIRQALVFHRFIFISDIHTITIHKAFNTDYYKSLGENYRYLENMTPEEIETQFHKLCDSLNLSPAELIYSSEKGKYEKSRIQGVNKQHEKLITDGKLTYGEVEKLVLEGESKSKFRQYFEYGLSMWIPLNWYYRYEPMTVEKEILPPVSRLSFFIIFITTGIFLPLIIMAVLQGFKSKNYFLMALIFIFLIHTMIHTLTYVETRYLLPLLPYITAVGYQGLIYIRCVYKNIHLHKLYI